MEKVSAILFSFPNREIYGQGIPLGAGSSAGMHSLQCWHWYLRWGHTYSCHRTRALGVYVTAGGVVAPPPGEWGAAAAPSPGEAQWHGLWAAPPCGLSISKDWTFSVAKVSAVHSGNRSCQGSPALPDWGRLHYWVFVTSNHDGVRGGVMQVKRFLYFSKLLSSVLSSSAFL